jgi:hypothetical protein
MESEPGQWFRPDQKLIIANPVGEADATTIRRALANRTFPDGTSLAPIARFSTDTRVIEPLEAYCEAPEEWTVRDVSTLDDWTEIRTAYARGETKAARQRAVARLDSVVPFDDGTGVTLYRLAGERGVYRPDGEREVRPTRRCRAPRRRRRR